MRYGSILDNPNVTEEEKVLAMVAFSEAVLEMSLTAEQAAEGMRALGEAFLVVAWRPTPPHET